MDPSLFKNYVYNSDAGSKSFIYHLEDGIDQENTAVSIPLLSPPTLTL
jgi:hypothetical protein